MKNLETLAFVFVGLFAASESLAVLSIDATGFQQTKCVTQCSLGGEMVCGSDGKTYPSTCHLEKYSCETKSAIQMAYPGSCGCPTSCQKNYKPVCATLSTNKKEKTYPNMCEFKRSACQMKLKNKLLTFSRKGPCKKMKTCPSSCQDVFAPVCGGDNITYSSVCALKLASCNKNKKIGLSKIGRCNAKECPLSCPMTYQLICGNDGLWHPSECEMKLTACKSGKVVKKVRRKREKKVCGSKRCVAYCPAEVSPVCGEDGLTYVNKCSMHMLNCRNGRKVKIGSKGKCNQNKFSKKK